MGIVTSFTYRLDPVGPEVLGGMVMWGQEDAPEVLRAYREFVASAPPEVGTAAALLRVPPAPHLPVELHRRHVCAVAMLALGEPEEAERLLAPIRTFDRPLLDLVTWRPYTNLAVDARRWEPRRLALLLEVGRAPRSRRRRDRDDGSIRPDAPARRGATRSRSTSVARSRRSTPSRPPTRAAT